MVEDDTKFEQVAHKEAQEKLAKEEAVSDVGNIRDQVYVKGANESELTELSELLVGLENGDVLPESAKKRAREILNSKQDYH